MTVSRSQARSKCSASLTAIVIISCIFFTLAFTSQASADEPSRGSTVRALLDAAFSDRMWNDDAVVNDGNGFEVILDKWDNSERWDIESTVSKQNYLTTSAHHPWLADYMYHPNGWPRHNVINKWADRFTVAIGWPRFDPASKAPVGIEESLWTVPGGEKLYPIIQEAVESSLPTIRKVTNLEARFIAPNDPAENTASYGRVRIIPEPHWLPRQPQNLESTYWEPEAYETWLWGAVPLTTSHKQHMDAYFLPNPDNTIGLAVCKIDSRVDNTLLKKLVSECLLFALGIPRPLELNRKAVYSSDGDKIDRTGNPVNQDNLYPTILDDDISRLVKLLYCPSLTTGSDKLTVLRTLLSKNTCFDNL